MIRERLQALLAGKLPPAAYRLNARIATREIRQAVADAGWRFHLLDLRNVTHKSAFMTTAADALQLPPYFGRNWDAFEEVLNDLPFGGAEKDGARGDFVLVDRTSPLRYSAPGELRTALDILSTAAQARRDSSRPLVVIVRGAGPLAADLPVLG